MTLELSISKVTDLMKSVKTLPGLKSDGGMGWFQTRK